ncbi:Pentatricopeptide repeat [Dillenia turbinata]|uniref:Pentatricopeptide repeat n=1 Tax=Dillenia turbinata TaxID=194707 RepID=A0AAN8W966_9MAGN
MRGKLSEVYTECDKQMIDGMLLIIVNKVVSEMEKGNLERMIRDIESVASHDLSDDLWKTVWEMSNMVLEDMRKAEKEKMKGFLRCAEVNEMCRFAGEVGIRGDMLRELRFKWAREKTEESDFYQSLERVQAEDKAYELQKLAMRVLVMPISLLQLRNLELLLFHGDVGGLMADKIHDMGELTWPQKPKPASGMCKLVVGRIMSLKEEDDPSAQLAEWVELLQPSRIDWMALLNKLEEQILAMYYKLRSLHDLFVIQEPFICMLQFVIEMLGAMLDWNYLCFWILIYLFLWRPPSAVRAKGKIYIHPRKPNQDADMMLIDAHAKNNRMEDAERILKKMTENGIMPDILTSTILVHMYGKAGNLEVAKQAFESFRGQGFQPGIKLYCTMIMAHVNGGHSKMGESLMREMEIRDIKPTKEIYMALLCSFAEQCIIDDAHRIATTMELAGFGPSLESCMLLLEVYGWVGEADQARKNFDNMMQMGLKPLMTAYEKKNSLDKALDLLLQLEEDGFEPGAATYSVLVDWFSKMQLVDEVEQKIGRIALLGETPLKIHISLCDTYSRAGMEKKFLQTQGVLEAKKEQLGYDDFERIINGPIAGHFEQDAQSTSANGATSQKTIAFGTPLAVPLRESETKKYQGKKEKRRY